MWVEYRVAPGLNTPRPWVRLYIPAANSPIFALVDSGSDRSSFPLTLGTALGLTYNPEEAPRKGLGALGPFDYVSATNDLHVTTDVGPFLFRLPLLLRGGPTYCMLGRSDFFRAYRVKFYEREGGMEIEAYDQALLLN